MGMKKDPSTFDWNQLEQILGTSLPFFPKGMRDKIQDTSWVSSYVQDVMNKMMSSSTTQQSGKDLPYEEFETHKSIILKLKIPKKIHPRSLRVQVGRGNVRIQGLPDGHIQCISLSKPVDHHFCRASYKKQVLIVRMRKEAENEIFRDIRIRHQD